MLTGESGPGYWEDTGHRSTDGYWEDTGYSHRRGDTGGQGYREDQGYDEVEELYRKDDQKRKVHGMRGLQQYGDWGWFLEDGAVLPEPQDGGWEGGLRRRGRGQHGNPV